ncbi:MAG: hypothetical protein KDJ90_18840 [Nitratireductor sp.]|nr:hypothetical protein [Nitratireductor sp.]
MSDDNTAIWHKLEEISRISGELGEFDDDAVRMFAQRVDSLARAFRDSMLVSPDLGGLDE